MKNTIVNMHRLLNDINNKQARSNLMWDSAMADYQVHQIEHQLGAFTDCNHVQGLSVIQPDYYKRG